MMKQSKVGEDHFNPMMRDILRSTLIRAESKIEIKGKNYCNIGSSLWI